MSVVVEFRAEARAEIDEAYVWYESRAPGLGGEFSRAIEVALGLIARQPGSWPLVHRQIRRVLVRRFPYSLLYKIEGDRVIVIACFHGRRDPKLWKQR